MRDREHCEWVVERGAFDAVVTGDVIAREELEQRRDQVGEGPSHRGDLVDPSPSDEELVGHVETGHRDRQPGLVDDLRRLRVGPDVELGDGRAVAEGAAAHQRDPGDVVREVGCRPQRERDVGERAGRYEPDAGLAPTGVDDEADGVIGVGSRVGLGQVGAVQPTLAVDEAGEPGRCDERPSSAGMHAAAEVEQIAHDTGVVGRTVERRVAGHRGDADQIGVAVGDHDRDHVVVTGIAVEDDARPDAR